MHLCSTSVPPGARRAVATVLAAAALALTGTGGAVAAPAPASARAAAPTLAGAADHAPGSPARPDPRLTASAQARSLGRAVAVTALTTADSTTTAEPNGSFVTDTTTLPTRMKNHAGAWVTIDAALTSSGGRLATTATPNALSFSAGGTGPLVSVADGHGHALALTLAGVALPAPSVSGAAATYANVYPGVSLTVTAQPSGSFTEVFEVRDAAAAAHVGNLRFTTSLRGLVVHQDASGNLAAVDAATGATVLTAPVPALWDSATAARPQRDAPDLGAPHGAASVRGPGARSHVAVLPVTVDASGITLHAGAAELGGTTQYPEFIDPTWTLPTQTGGIQDTGEAQQGCPTYVDYNSQTDLGVGNVETNTSCPGGYRSFYTDNTSNLNSGDKIVSSYIYIAEVYSASLACGTSEPITVDWTSPIPSGMSWNDQPSIDGRGDPVTSTTVKTDGGGSCGAYDYQFDVTSAMTQLAADNSSNWTYGLYGNESTADTLVRFNDNPSIVTTYDILPAIPTATALSPVPQSAPGSSTQDCGGAASAAGWIGRSSLAGTDVATMTATVSSAAPGAQVRGDFSFSDTTAGTSSSGDSAYVGGHGSVSVSTPALIDGHAYSWHVQGDDGYYTGTAAGTCQFKVDLTPPNNPAVASTAFPPLSSGGSGLGTGQSGTLTLSAADPVPSGGVSSGIAGFYYSIDTPLPATGATLHTASGSLALSESFAGWGTHTLYSQSIDKAGNVSSVNEYQFYVPYNPSAPVVPGDVTGTGVSDLLTTNPAGDLVAFKTSQNPAAGGIVLSTPTYSPDGTSWANYEVTHYGSYTQQSLADVWAFNATTKQLYLYKNQQSSAGSFETTANITTVTKQDVNIDALGSPTADACADTVTAPNSCASYDDTDWDDMTQMLAVGDLYAGDPVPGIDPATTSTFPGYDMLTVEGGALWLYQGQGSPYYLGDAAAPVIQLGTSGWTGMTLMYPGLVSGKPVIWARNDSTGVVYSYPITFDSEGYPESLGTPTSGSGTQIGTGFTAVNYPAVSSPGTLPGASGPALYAVNAADALLLYPAGSTAGTLSSSATVVGSLDTMTDRWRLADATCASTADSAGGLNSLAVNGEVTCGSSITAGGATMPAFGFDGSSGFLDASGPVIDTGGSYAVSAWADPTAIPAGGIQEVAALCGDSHCAMYLEINATGDWAFAAAASDASGTTTYPGPTGPAAVANTWTHLVGVYDKNAQTLTLYVNGTSVGSAAFTTPWTASGPLTLGATEYATGGTSHFFDGYLSDARVYSSAISAAQVAQIYAQPTVDPLLAPGHEWSLADGPGATGSTVAHDAFGGDDAPFGSAAAWANDATRGESLSLDGAAGSAAVASGPALNTEGSFTVSAWVKPMGTPEGAVVSQDGANISGFILYVNASGGWSFAMAPTDSTTWSANSVASAAGTAASGVWTHLVGVYTASSGTMQLYVNGALVASGTFTPVAWSATGPFAIGRDFVDVADNAWFDGEISDVDVYNSALTQAQVTERSTAGGLVTQLS